MRQNNSCRYYHNQVLIRLVLTLNGVLVHFFCLAQQGDTVRQFQLADTARPAFIERIKKLGDQEKNKTATKFKEGRVAKKQNELLENITRATQRSNEYLRRGIDTFDISAELDKINQWYDIISDGVLINKGNVQTHRNLSISSQLLRELIYKTDLQKIKLDNYDRDLGNLSDELDSLTGDSAIYNFPSDSVTIVRYLQKIAIVAAAVNPADSNLKASIVNVQSQQRRVNLLANMLRSRHAEVETFRKELSDKILKRELPNLWDPATPSRPLRSIMSFSKEKGMLALWFYTSDNLAKMILLLLLIIGAFLFLRSLKEKINSHGLLNTNFNGQLIFRYPLLSAIMIVLSLFQFIFFDPPFIFNVWFWIISAGCLTVIFWNYISKFWMFFWLTMLFLFGLASVDNFILQASGTERCCMIMLACAGVVSGSYFLLKGHKNELKEKRILYFIGFVVLLEFASIISNMYGRYNLSKTLLTSGYFSLIIAILFLWSVRMINEALSHASEMYIRPEKRLFFINFDRVGNKVPSIFYVLLIIGWFVLVGRNFYAYKLISEPFEDFLAAERTIGKYSFSFTSILIFFMILVLAVLTSKIVSYFSTENEPGTSTNSKTAKAGLGSWLLLVRIAIVSMGLFLAFAAAGIPMDRLTIILGALSVGIGFGLQTLINNLVSGLIIAFEKPVNVGDIVEIGGKTGTMKSIGFRSSVISTWEGSDVIIPNGELLSQHLVNWTMSDTTRRVEIIVGVAYGTDLIKAKEVLNKQLASNEQILKNPAPMILLNEFSNSSIDIRVLFWVKHYKEWIAAKSQVIENIDVVFKENAIRIPFPQRDLHIRTENADASQEQKD